MVVWSSDAVALIRDINGEGELEGWETRLGLLHIRERKRANGSWVFCWDNNPLTIWLTKQLNFLWQLTLLFVLISLILTLSPLLYLIWL